MKKYRALKMDGVCIVLFVCTRANGPNYTSAFNFWSNEVPSEHLFVVDCISTNTTLMNKIDYSQKEPISMTNSRGSYFSQQELHQMKAVNKQLPDTCNFVYKITGKYQIASFWETIKQIHGENRSTKMVVQGGRRHSFWGWSSEVFGCDRKFLNAVLMDTRIVKINTERLVLKMIKIVKSIDAARLTFLGHLQLLVPIQRTSDNSRLFSL